MDAYDVIRQAIQDKDQVRFTYHGHTREACPHAIGTKDGRRHVLFFQFGGTSSSGLPAGGEWRCVDVDQIEDLAVAPGEWQTGPGHRMRQTCIDYVDMEVDY